jgi:hypothetical protein
MNHKVVALGPHSEGLNIWGSKKDPSRRLLTIAMVSEPIIRLNFNYGMGLAEVCAGFLSEGTVQ